MRKQASKPIKRVEQVWDIQDYLRVCGYRQQECQRNYMLFTLGVTTGYRAGDLVALKIRDVRDALKHGCFTIYEGKRVRAPAGRVHDRRPRKVEIVDRLARELKQYIKGHRDYEWMFPSRKGNGHIGVQAVSNILKDAGQYFGLEQITAHSMRKTYAYKVYLDSNKDVMVVKELLGHKNIEWTKAYLGLDQERFHEVMKGLNDFVR